MADNSVAIDFFAKYTPTEMCEELRPFWKNGAPSMRATQRMAALWIATKNDGHVDRETLREACRQLRVYDTALFNYYMADERIISRGRNHKRGVVGAIWFHELGRAGAGWELTEAGWDEARRLFA